jgi:DNA-binding transcriptional LysR family regulator
MERLDLAELVVRDRTTSPRGRVRVDVDSSMAHAILIPALADFRKKHRGI